MSDTFTQDRPNGQTDQGQKTFSQHAQGVADDLKSKAGNVKDTVQKAVSEGVETVKGAATDVAGQAREKVESAATHQKSLGADYIGALAGAMNRAASEFDGELPQAAHYIRQASDQVTGFADSLRQRDLRELASDVQDFARKQPTLFFGGAVILGFAALRFFKSAAPAQERPSASEQRRDDQGA
jgi:uncharacterized phage infection (PIP) family protein YhgE